MTREIVEYTADLKFPPLTKKKLAALNSVAKECWFEIDLTETSLLFKYSGRDAGNWALIFLDKTAAILENANGIIERETIWGNDEETSERFQIKNGCLTIIHE